MYITYIHTIHTDFDIHYAGCISNQLQKQISARQLFPTLVLYIWVGLNLVRLRKISRF